MSHRTPHTALYLAAALLALAFAVVPPTASATDPGKNGPIAFRRYFDTQQTWGAVFTMRPDGTGTRQITQPPRGTVDDQPAWAPDGSLLTFFRCPSGGTCHVYVVAPDGSGLTPVGTPCVVGANETTCPDDSEASFSPDSKQLAIVRATGSVKRDSGGEEWIEHSAIVILNRDGSGPRVLYQAAAFSGDLGYPVFSPKGSQVLFERTPSGFAPHAHHRAIFFIRSDGTHLRRLTPWAENDGDNPDWSPDGNWILFHSHVDDPINQSQIFIIHPDGTGRTQLTHFAAGTHVASSVFSPDGKWIAFSKGPEGGNIDVWVMRLDGTHLHRVTHSKLWESAPDWGPR